MNEIRGMAAAAALLVCASAAHAGDLDLSRETVVAKTGFYIGVGGSFNGSRFDQSLQGVSGLTEVSFGPILLAEGQAGGPFFKFNRDESAFAPDVQLGYTVPFAGGLWQAGLKFAYKFGSIDSNESVTIPQEGSVTTTIGPPVNIDFTGFVPIRSAKIALRHQFALMPVIGRSFGKVTVYAGGGPALFNVKTEFLDGMCFAVINGTLVNVCGETLNFRSEDWIWGGAAQIGATYALGERWFLDLAYMFAQSEEFKLKYSTPFINQNGPLTSQGVANLIAHQQIANQSVVLTLNRRF
ncbi:MAG TPA: hypothetical protein VFG05_03565 [Methylocella sp.]|nr:hypothetical protein [Methylocella sp.]